MKKIFIFLFIPYIFLASCSPAKLVPKNQKWYHAASIKVDGELEGNTEANLTMLIRQKPNKKSLFWRSLRLDWYNFLGGDKHKIRGNWVSRNYYRVKNWMAETMGTPPIIYKPEHNLQSVKNMKDYLKSKGYYFAEVKDSVVTDSIWLFNDPKVKVFYNIKPGKPYIINDIKYEFVDRHILEQVKNDTINRKFNRGELFDASHLQSERVRITDTLKNRGYYKFAKEYIYYSVDKVAENRVKKSRNDSSVYDLVDVTMKLKPYIERVKGRNIVYNYHPIFKVEDIYISPNYDAKKALHKGDGYFNKLDTIEHNGLVYLNDGDPNIHYSTLERGLSYEEGDVYNASKIQQTNQYLNSLSAIKLASTYFSEIEQEFPEDTINEMRIRYLNPHINISHATRQSYSIDIEGSYADRYYYGINGSLNYQHKNLFKGSENFKVSFLTSWANNQIIQDKKEKQEQNIDFNTVKYGVDSRLAVPKFFVPFGFSKFSKKYKPQTVFQAGFSFENRPDFNNQNMHINFGYKWSTSNTISHYFSPISLYATQIISISETYRNLLKEKNLLANFSDKIIPAVSYTFIYSGKPEDQFDNYSYFHTKIESAGNLLVSYSQATDAPKQTNEYFSIGNGTSPSSGESKNEEMYHFLNLPIAQYVLAEIDWRYYIVFDPERKLVYRIFTGAGVPYGNFPALPSRKQYLSGGMSSLRGWSPGHVGPGTASYKRMNDAYASLNRSGFVEQTNLYQQRGELKLEFNIEYRMQVTEMVETAFFFDIGNTWALTKYNSTQELADELNAYINNGTLTGEIINPQFDSSTFYRQLAYNTGIGFRFDLSFFILRLDFGAKINDPGDPDAGIFRSWGLFDSTNWRLNFGIGHPF